MQCAHCGGQTFEVSGPITIWRAQTIRFTDDLGNYTVEHDELGETTETHDWETARCADCDYSLPVGMLFGSVPQDS